MMGCKGGIVDKGGRADPTHLRDRKEGLALETPIDISREENPGQMGKVPRQGRK